MSPLYDRVAPLTSSNGHPVPLMSICGLFPPWSCHHIAMRVSHPCHHIANPLSLHGHPIISLMLLRGKPIAFLKSLHGHPITSLMLSHYNPPALHVTWCLFILPYHALSCPSCLLPTSFCPSHPPATSCSCLTHATHMLPNDFARDSTLFSRYEQLRNFLSNSTRVTRATLNVVMLFYGHLLSTSS